MLLAQTYPAHELLVVDQTLEPDEATYRTLSEWNQLGQIHWLRQTEPNASKARNAGALAATGEVVLFLDDDIRVKPDFLAAYAETFARTGAMAVSGQVLEGDGNTVDDLPPNAFYPKIGWLYFRHNYSKECRTTSMMSGNAAIRRDVFLAVGGMDENYERGAFREESDFAMRFSRAGYLVVFQPRATIYHLGNTGAPYGGARNQTKNKWIAGFHHCVGDWYFNLRYARGRLILPLFEMSIRHFVLNRYNIAHPWWLPILFFRWLSAFPVALSKRVRGPIFVSNLST
jgi:GT2 family glycosyltransferase